MPNSLSDIREAVIKAMGAPREPEVRGILHPADYHEAKIHGIIHNAINVMATEACPENTAIVLGTGGPWTEDGNAMVIHL